MISQPSRSPTFQDMWCGELDVAAAASAAAAAGRQRAIIVDLAGMEFIDSSGMAALVLALSHARPAGGRPAPRGAA